MAAQPRLPRPRARQERAPDMAGRGPDGGHDGGRDRRRDAFWLDGAGRRWLAHVHSRRPAGRPRARAAPASRFAGRHAHDERLGFGTGKLGELAGYSSAIILAMIALLIGYESALRLVSPVPIAFDQAIAVAAVGLIVNLASAWLLR